MSFAGARWQMNTTLHQSRPTLGARGFSCAVSGFGQVLKSDPREKPLDQSAIPLIAPSQLQHRLYQNIQNLIGSLEISKVSDALTGLQSQQARDRDTGGLKVIKDQIQTIQAHITYV